MLGSVTANWRAVFLASDNARRSVTIVLATESLDDRKEIEDVTYDRDPDDAHYVNLALAADARLILSRGKDLLDLMDSTKPEAAEFQKRFPTLRILNPVGFLREVAS